MSTIQASSVGSVSKTAVLLGGATAALCFIHVPGVPLAEIALGLWTVVVLSNVLRRKTPCPAPPTIFTVLFCWIALSFARSAGWGAGKDVIQAGLILCVAPCIFQQVKGNERLRLAIVRGIAAGATLSMLVAVIQYAAGTPAIDVCGLAANRPLYGVLLVVATPFFLSLTAPLQDRWRITSQFLFVLLGCTTILHIGALVLFAVATIAWMILNGSPRIRIDIAAALALSALCILGNICPRPNRQLLQQSLSTKDAKGRTRRWVVELEAAGAATKDAIMLGHGLGNYQSIVSSAKYRAGLPAPAENRVAPGTQCGFVTLAVTSGLPSALLLIIALGAALRFAGKTRETAIAATLILPAMAFTPLFVQGAGILLGAIAGMLLAERDRHPLSLRTTGLAQAVACTSAVVIGAILFVRHTTHTPAHRPPTATAADLIIIEAECATGSNHFARQNDDGVGAHATLNLITDDKAKLENARPATCQFTCTTPGTYYLWFRAWWRDGCANSIRAGVDGSRPELVGNDGTYKSWHWVRGHAVELSKGEHRLAIHPTEIGVRLDQVLLASNKDYYPEGIIGEAKPPLPPPLKPIAPALPKQIAAQPRPVPKATALPPLYPLPEPTAKPFRAATGGAYRLGAEAFFCELGIPYDRLEQCETTRIEVLRKYDLIYLSGAMIGFPQRPMYETLLKYVQEGGTLILEQFQSAGKSTAEMTILGQVVSDSFRPVTVVSNGSFPFQNFPATQVEHRDIAIHPLVRYGNAEKFGEIICRCPSTSKSKSKKSKSKKKNKKPPHPSNRRIGPAIIHKKIGKGDVWLPIVPLGFTSMWRSRDFDPVAYNLLRHIVKDRFVPMYERLQRPFLEPVAKLFSDDFMRMPGQMGGWSIDSGSFRMTGPQGKWATNAFLCIANKPGRISTGNPAWNDYCLTASISPGNGGIWANTTNGSRLLLELVGSEIVLSEETHDGTKPLSRTSLVGNQSGWHRLSLLARDDQWEAFVDGVRRLNIPTKGQLKGRFGLIARSSAVSFDDVRACASSNILPGLDRAWGEEGSPMCITPTQKGLEPRTVYAASWYMYPDPHGRDALQLGMPPFQGAMLLLNNKPVVRLPASTEMPMVALPSGITKADTFNLLCPGWRDYMFGPQMTDWYGVGAKWHRTSRWNCSPTWEWLGARTKAQTTLWYRHVLKPPYAITVYAASASEFKYGQEQGRDLNLVLGGDGVRPESGLVLHTGSASRGCELRWNGKVLARNRTIGLPRGHELHHRWFELKAIVEPNRIRCFYERHPIFDHNLSIELPVGHIGFWTYRNSVRVARATLATSQIQ